MRNSLYGNTNSKWNSLPFLIYILGWDGIEYKQEEYICNNINFNNKKMIYIF
jgi:hypothetical protein